MGEDQAAIDLDSKLARALEQYSSTPAVRATVQAILAPTGFGASIEVLFAGLGTEIRERRFRRLLEHLKDEIGRIDESKVDRDFLRSEEFYDLMVKAAELAVRTREDEKRLGAARVLRGALLGVEVSACEQMLQFIGELSALQMLLLREIHEQQRATPRKSREDDPDWARRAGWHEFVKRWQQQVGDDLHYHLARITSAGALREWTGGYLDKEGNSQRGGIYLVTPTFFRLMSKFEARSA